MIKNNKPTTNKRDINEVFKIFYQELYTSQVHVEEQKRTNLFSCVKIPTLTEEQRNLIEGEISLAEVKQAIHSLQLGKAPGNDGFPSDF